MRVVKYFTDPQSYHMAAARALAAVGNMRARTDVPCARDALRRAQVHIEAAQAATIENGFVAPHMEDWPI